MQSLATNPLSLSIYHIYYNRVITRAGILSSAGCSPCTTAFRLCLKEYQTTEQGASISTGCSFGNSTTKILGGSSFVLSDPGVGAIVLPFTFRWTVSALFPLFPGHLEPSAISHRLLPVRSTLLARAGLTLALIFVVLAAAAFNMRVSFEFR